MVLLIESVTPLVNGINVKYLPPLPFRTVSSRSTELNKEVLLGSTHETVKTVVSMI